MNGTFGRKPIEAIAAIQIPYGAIGYKDGSLIMDNPNDKRMFVKLTRHKTMVVGRKTFETLPPKVLEREIMIVHGSNKDKVKEQISRREKSYIVIGGAQTYGLFEDIVDVWHITWHRAPIKMEKRGELVTYFPDLSVFKELERHTLDKRMDYIKYVKIR